MELAAVATAQAATTTVQVGQQNGGTAAASQFNAASITISAGDTVHWTWFSNTFGHTVTSYDETGSVPDWQSPVLNGSGQSFDHTFTTAGVYTYYCSIHATRADADPANIDANIAAGLMVGKITVTSSSVGGIASVPDVTQLPAASASGGGGSRRTAAVIAVAAGGAAVAATAGAMMRRKSRRRRRIGIAEGDHER